MHKSYLKYYEFIDMIELMRKVEKQCTYMSDIAHETLPLKAEKPVIVTENLDTCDFS